MIAAGRCSACERAYCGSHRALTFEPYVRVAYIDLCSACRDVPEEQRHQREADKATAAERRKQQKAEQLALAEDELRKVLTELREAGLPGVETRYRNTYPPKHYFTSATKLKRVEIGKGWSVGELDFRWTPPSDYGSNGYIVQRTAMVLPCDGSIVHAEPDDIYHHDHHEKFIRTAEQMRLVVERLSLYLR
ncbi:hypothetical protein AB0M48_35265 [Lentzea sp. NPDC051208]|uniref:hypothetical protein n=1 Tax=Lentzea sp. NPDC051208 TaxID=3154642 RepID=UPI003424FCF7